MNQEVSGQLVQPVRSSFSRSKSIGLVVALAIASKSVAASDQTDTLKQATLRDVSTLLNVFKTSKLPNQQTIIDQTKAQLIAHKCVDIDGRVFNPPFTEHRCRSDFLDINSLALKDLQLVEISPLNSKKFHTSWLRTKPSQRICITLKELENLAGAVGVRSPSSVGFIVPGSTAPAVVQSEYLSISIPETNDRVLLGLQEKGNCVRQITFEKSTLPLMAL